MSPLPFEPPPARPSWEKIVGRLIADLLIAATSGAVVWAWGGPTWANVATGIIVFQSMRAANFVVGMGRRG